MSRQSIHRRSFLGLGALATAALTVPALSFGSLRRARAQASQAPRFLFVLAAKGGASIVDSLLPVAASEVSSPERAQTLVAYPDSLIAQPPGSNIRSLRTTELSGGPLFVDYDITDFVARHKEDMLVMTVENTSVDHRVAQKRAITGDSFDRGRTIMEAVAAQYGQDLPLANCNLSRDGYIDPGDDKSLPAFARGQLITDPTRFALATHGHRGVAGAPSAAHLERARGVREELETLSPWAARFAQSQGRGRYLGLRREVTPKLEAADLITKLMLLQDSPETPLSTYGLETSPDGIRLMERFPELGRDAMQTQAALAYLLVRYGASSTVTFGPSDTPSVDTDGRLLTSPVALDFSHAMHVPTQAFMWSRMLKALDGLIALLKAEPYGGGSMWDASLIYVATDFGRSKEVPPGGLFQVGSGHDLNNGNLLISPLLAGNRVYGGVDPETCLTYGFDPRTGEPDPGRRMTLGHIYSLISQAMGIDFPGRHDMSALLR